MKTHPIDQYPCDAPAGECETCDWLRAEAEYWRLRDAEERED